MGRGAAGSREPGGGRRRGAGPGREALPARASGPRPRRPGPAQPRRATRGRGGGGSAADTPSRPAPAAPRLPGPPPAPGPPPQAPWAPSPGSPPAPPGPPAAGPSQGCRRIPPPRALQESPARRPRPEAPFPGAASASVARSSRSFLPFGRLAFLARACILFSSSLSPGSLSLSVSPCPCLWLTLHGHPTPCVLSPSFSQPLALLPSLRLAFALWALLTPSVSPLSPFCFCVPGAPPLSMAPSVSRVPLSSISVCPHSLCLCLPDPQPSLAFPISHSEALP